MILKDIISRLKSEIPDQLQESYDNTGLQIGDPEAEIDRALLCLDVTMNILKEASENNCGLVISHHPMMFKGLKKLDFGSEDGKMIAFAIKNNIAVYSIHTSIDKYGVSIKLAEKLGLQNIEVLQPEKGVLRKLVTFCPVAQAVTLRNALFAAGAGHIGRYDSCSYNLEGLGTFRALDGAKPFVGAREKLHQEKEMRIETIFPVWKQSTVIRALLANHPYEEVAYDIYMLENELVKYGLGAVGELKSPLTVNDFLLFIKQHFGNTPLRYNSFSGKIFRVALCGGSGASLLSLALAGGAQAFITGDVKYHDFQAASNKIMMIDAGHYETEIQVLHLIKELISEKMPTFATLISETNTNYVKYLK